MFARRVGFWGAKQAKLEQILDALPGDLSTNDVDRIPFLAEYVRAESGARGVDKKWLEKHSFDRTATGSAEVTRSSATSRRPR